MCFVKQNFLQTHYSNNASAVLKKTAVHLENANFCLNVNDILLKIYEIDCLSRCTTYDIHIKGDVGLLSGPKSR